MKRILGIVLLALAISALACNAPSPASTAANSPAPTVETPAAAPATETAILAPTVEPTGAAPEGWLTYGDEAAGFEVSYPDSGIPINTNPPTVGDEHSLRIDLPFAPDTNLSEKYLQIDARQGDTCASPALEGFEPGLLQADSLTIGDLTWQRVSHEGVAAGNFYTFTAYSTARESVCVALTFVLHSFNVGNVSTPPAEYDPAAESAIFEEIVATFRWLP